MTYQMVYKPKNGKEGKRIFNKIVNLHALLEKHDNAEINLTDILEDFIDYLDADNQLTTETETENIVLKIILE